MSVMVMENDMLNKKKQKLVMCNYYGMCDSSGDAVGHTIKVTNEYSQLLSEIADIELVASPCIVQAAKQENFTHISALKYNISISGNSCFKRIFDKYKLIYNIHQAVQEDKNYFIYQVDFFFFFYIFLFYKKSIDRKVFCLICHQDFTNKVFKNLFANIYNVALKKIDGVIYTQKGKQVSHPNAVWMPDYLYEDKQYLNYKQIEKENRVVCVGTMNRYKQLEELVDTFSELEMPLIISGRFDSKERFAKLLENKSDNIQIYDTNMAYEEYLRLIASAKYSILPYDMGQYKDRTSGVLLESIYVGSIPIAPHDLLKQNMLNGIGYNTISELAKINFDSLENVIDFERISREYSKENIIIHLQSLFQ